MTSPAPGSHAGVAGTGLAQRGRTQEQPWHPHRPQPLSRLAAWAALLAPGIALLVADGYDLGRPSLWRDEAYTVDAAHRSLSQIIALLQHTDAVNSAYYMVMHADIAVAGTSAVALRLPSLLAMAVAAVATSAIGQWLARAARLPAPALTGAVAGLLFTAAPQVTRYAQEARSYGIVTMCAAIATYLLLRALGSSRWHWWAGYGLAVALAGLFNLFSLLLVIAHGVTLGIGRARQRAALAPPGTAVTVRISRWLAPPVRLWWCSARSWRSDSGSASRSAGWSRRARLPSPIWWSRSPGRNCWCRWLP